VAAVSPSVVAAAPAVMMTLLAVPLVSEVSLSCPPLLLAMV
jgi:hypothetical protein